MKYSKNQTNNKFGGKPEFTERTRFVVFLVRCLVYEEATLGVKFLVTHRAVYFLKLIGKLLMLCSGVKSRYRNEGIKYMMSRINEWA